jgi:hypothetical protein
VAPSRAALALSKDVLDVAALTLVCALVPASPNSVPSLLAGIITW